MAKKSRRTRAKHRTTAARPAEGRPLQQPGAMSAGVQSRARVPSQAQVLTSRYQYVMPELRRIAIIGGAMLLVLIILSFVLG